jgi:hypothetical protein
MNPEAKMRMVCDAWRVAAGALSFRIEAPYAIRTPSGKEVPCVGFLPDFGSRNGMVIGLTSGPAYEIDKELKLAAESQKVFYTFINGKAYDRYNEEIFKEALVDWGYFGHEDQRPEWLQRPTETQ